MEPTYRTQSLEIIRQRVSAFDSPQEQFACSVRAERVRDRLSDEHTYDLATLTREILPSDEVITQSQLATGEDAIHDLSLLIEELSAETVISTDTTPERVYTINTLAKRWNVTPKTISRWRRRGLTARTFSFGGKRRIGFLQSSADHFERQHPALVRRGRSFKRFSDEERSHIAIQAKDMLTQPHLTPDQVVERLANETARSAQTIRHFLKHAGIIDAPGHDAIGVGQASRLYREYRRGKSIEVLANQTGLPAPVIKLEVDRLRANRILELKIDYMPSSDFFDPAAAANILSPQPENQGPIRKPRKPSELPAYIASLYEVPLLTSEQEAHQFRKYNFLKFTIAQAQKTLDARRPSTRALTKIERMYEQSLAINNLLVRSNLRLVVSVAKKYVEPTGDLFEKISEGNISLMRAVEKFDYTRGFKFSTYATWAIKKNFIRSYATAMKHAERFRTGHEELLDTRIAHRANPQVELEVQKHRERQVATILEHLSDRERDIIRSRFGINSCEEPKTLQEVGNELGVSKERVRQLESRALDKLRYAVHSRFHAGAFND